METKRRILEAATIEFAERGYHGATVRSIARRAGVNVAMIGYYFESKAGLYREVLKNHLDELVLAISGMPEDPIEAIKFFVERHISIVRKRGKLTLLLVMREIAFQTDVFKEIKDLFYGVIEEKLLKIIEEAVSKGYINKRHKSYAIQYLIYLDLFFAFKFENMEPFKLADKVLQLFLKGVGS